jgi:hypothetical protein
LFACRRLPGYGPPVLPKSASFRMKYDPSKPAPDYNTTKVSLLGLGMAALLLAIFLSIMIPLYHLANVPVR